MKFEFLTWRSLARTRFLAVGALLALTSLPFNVVAQQQLSRRYPAGKNVRIELRNISGTIVVESWNKSEIRLTATIESKKAQVLPRQTDESLVVDVMSDNRGRGDIGSINFKLQVPVNSSVDLETISGNINVTNIRSGLVRAHVSTEGDIELTNIVASQVIAQNITGNIFFDGELLGGGNYEFKSNKGDITIRIPVNSDFRFVASSPARRIAMNDFWNDSLKSHDGRKYEGYVGGGHASLSIINYSGQITFMRR
jgi:Putative adhesin